MDPKQDLPAILSEDQKLYLDDIRDVVIKGGFSHYPLSLGLDEGGVVCDIQDQHSYFGKGLEVRLLRLPLFLCIQMENWDIVPTPLPFYAPFIKLLSYDAYDTLCLKAKDPLGMEILALAQEYHRETLYHDQEHPYIRFGIEISTYIIAKGIKTLDAKLWDSCSRKHIADFLRDLHSYKG